jgi:hypothetical protein
VAGWLDRFRVTATDLRVNLEAFSAKFGQTLNLKIKNLIF